MEHTMKKRTNIADSLGGVANSKHTSSQLVSEPAEKNNSQKLKRDSTSAITGHYPPEVRHQLKVLAAEQGRTMEDMIAESLNMLFALYKKPEIVPRSKN